MTNHRDFCQVYNPRRSRKDVKIFNIPPKCTKISIVLTYTSCHDNFAMRN